MAICSSISGCLSSTLAPAPFIFSPLNTFGMVRLCLDLLETREWPGHIRQLKKTLQVLVANSATTIIRSEDIDGDQSMSGADIIPCAPCAQSPMRKESCILIQKTWMDSGGNISLVARRLGISRTTIYKHIKGL